MSMELWVEKWRPQKLNEMVLSEENKSFFKDCIDKGEIPHLLLVGGPGTGKSTVARILVKELDAECLALNASDERGIDTVRDKVKQFVMFESAKKWKIVFLDEADYLTGAAQAVLRNMMEVYSKKSRFIMCVNYPKMIIEPVKSRCQTIEFSKLGEKERYVLVKGILEEEIMGAGDEEALSLISLLLSQGDVNTLGRLDMMGIRGEAMLELYKVESKGDMEDFIQTVGARYKVWKIQYYEKQVWKDEAGNRVDVKGKIW